MSSVLANTRALDHLFNISSDDAFGRADDVVKRFNWLRRLQALGFMVVVKALILVSFN
ncbi:hypothetical protein [Dokdonia sp. PRO95]|uniref:hypothetical protein n=1 Tax=Dokdonia sp. PRO95 TaxID=1239415 RepID=UPI000AE9E942|nr:hypothetical protein [Dokdonia sp. PRO95]